jgi:hypothetical protein
MMALARELRKDLEKTVRQARRVAETGARKVLEQLGVHHHEPYGSMSPEQRTLRNRLRAHGRQLGDRRDTQKGTQTIGRLVQECAYEHWHRMLFARLLAETDLLIEPQSGVAITLEECRELARDEGADWLALASDYAERMLPQIFRKGDPVLAVTLPPETRSQLEDLLKALRREVFTTDDSLGWVYQFWQADAKESINKSEKKIGADELPAVTQLFTEDYMVLFLLHNTLGAWWAGKVLAERRELATTAKSEDELRDACKVGDVEWSYLRFVREKAQNGTEGSWQPAAGTFKGWPKAAKDVTVLDPCMGSGHFLVFALPIFVSLRIAEEGLNLETAVEAVLRDNLFGLEIDQRCTQIAAFNLAFAAWRNVGHRLLPQLNLACSGLAIGVAKAEWLKLAEKAVTAADPDARRDLLDVEQNLLTAGLEERVKNGLEALYDLFAKAPWLGSLIDPRKATGDIFHEGFDKLEPLLVSIMTAADTDESSELAVAAQGMAKAAEILGREFTLVATNVPYLKRGQQDNILRDYISDRYAPYKGDIASVFQAHIHDGLADTSAIVTPQSWLFQPSYLQARGKFLDKIDVLSVAWLGAGAFETISGEVVKPCLVLSTSRTREIDARSRLLDVSELYLTEKISALANANFSNRSNNEFRQHPEKLISLTSLTSPANLLSAVAKSHKGITTNDDPAFVLRFWELPSIQQRWDFHQSTVSASVDFGGMSNIILFEGGQGRLRQLAAALTPDRHQDRRGNHVWGKRGIAISCTGSLSPSQYLGTKYDTNVAIINTDRAENLPAVAAFAWSPDFATEVRKIDKSLKVTNATLVKIPFELSHWKHVAAETFPNGLPKPHSNDPTQWLFDGHLCGSADPNTNPTVSTSSALVTPQGVRPGIAESPLQVAVARMLGYRWPRQTGSRFTDCQAVTPDELEDHADSDGIVCLTALKGELPAAARLNALFSAAFGENWSAAKLARLLTEVGYAGNSLDDWLRDGFFEQHCILFQNRPFIWHIWDGRRDGFHALINYHHLAASGGEGRRTLEKVIYSYLGDWVDQQRADQRVGVEGADGRRAAAEHLRIELTKILEGEPLYDLFIRWKPLYRQPIGWEPDINDGVRINIRPFMTARPLNARSKTACILRTTPKNIKWTKDRGKEPTRDREDYPWFWGWDAEDAACVIDFTGDPKFDGNRWNELHYSRSFKEAARARQAEKMGDKA